MIDAITALMLLWGMLVLIWVGLLIISVRGEKKTFNNGICKVCKRKLKRFDTDSQGGRGYTCPFMHYAVWVSYPCIDRRYKDEDGKNDSGNQ